MLNSVLCEASENNVCVIGRAVICKGKNTTSRVDFEQLVWSFLQVNNTTGHAALSHLRSGGFYILYAVMCCVMSCHVMSCHVMSCNVMSCHVMPC